jgi:hypothetical protein
MISHWFLPGLWIRIGSGFNDFVDSKCGSGSRGKIMKKKPTLLINFFQFYNKKVCCGSGSAFDPDSMTLWIRIELKCWIQIYNLAFYCLIGFFFITGVKNISLSYNPDHHAIIRNYIRYRYPTVPVLLEYRYVNKYFLVSFLTSLLVKDNAGRCKAGLWVQFDFSPAPAPTIFTVYFRKNSKFSQGSNKFSIFFKDKVTYKKVL